MSYLNITESKTNETADYPSIMKPLSTDKGDYLNTTEPVKTGKVRYLSGGRGGKDQNVGDGGVSGCLQWAVGALLLLLLERVRHHLEAGVHLHGNHTGAAHAG